MSLSKDFLPLMLETVVLKSQASLDKYGKQTFSETGASFRARLVYDEKIIRDNEGREIVQAGRAILYGVPTSLAANWQITLPDGSSPRITSVDTLQDEDGNHHSVVGFGKS